MAKYIQVCTYKLQICETILFNLYLPGFLSESSLSHALTWSKWCQILYFQRQKVLCENNREWRYWKTSQHSSTVPSCEYGSFQRSVIIITNNFSSKIDPWSSIINSQFSLHEAWFLILDSPSLILKNVHTVNQLLSCTVNAHVLHLFNSNHLYFPLQIFCSILLRNMPKHCCPSTWLCTGSQWITRRPTF